MYYINKFTRLRAPIEDDTFEGTGEDLSTEPQEVEEVTEVEDNSEEISEVAETSTTEEEVTPQKPSQTPPTPSGDSGLKELVSLLKDKYAREEAARAVPEKKPDPATIGSLELTAEDLSDMGFLEASPEQVKGMNKVLAKVVAAANAKANYELQTRLEAVNRDFSPVLEQHRAQQLEQHRNTFYAQYPNLKGKEEVVALVAQSLKHDPSTSNLSSEALFKKLAETTSALLNKHGVTNSAKPVPSGKPVVKPNTLSGTGRSTEVKKTQTPQDLQAKAAANIFG